MACILERCTYGVARLTVAVPDWSLYTTSIMTPHNNIREYIISNYASVLDQFTEDYGLNGWDLLFMSQTTQEVDALLQDYCSADI